jgi:hypothetical protein
MNKFLFFMLLVAANFSFAQVNLNSQDMDPNNGFIVASQFGVTRPIRDIFRENPVDEEKIGVHKYAGERKIRPAQQFPNKAEDNPKYGNDESILQKGMGHVEGSGMKVNWQGQTASGFRPYDPSGAAGPNHYVQMINSTTFRIYNKTTGIVLLTGLLGNLWSPATANAGDPIVMYDKTVDRWFLAQFGSGNNNIYIAVSTSGDPTGSYYTYTFVSPQFPDYLKFSVWSDGYYMTSNQAQKVFAFERTAMLAGVPTARSVYTSYAPPQGGGFFVPLPGDAADGTLPPLGTPCPIFSYSDNGWGGTNIDAIQIYQMAVNWVPATPTGTITLAAAVPTAAFDASYNASWNDCVQPGTTQRLDGIGGIVMYRAQWKSWAGYNTVVLNWAVRISASQRSIMWCELRQDQTTGVWSIYQQGIYTPDAATRWMGSMAMDNNGGIGLAYLKSDATSIFPGLYYTGRRPCDPLGTLPIQEVEVVAGTGFQTGTNRVGDYAHTCLDPDGVTFWSTGEYMGGPSGASAARTRIFSFSLPTCGTDASVSISVTGGTNPVCPGQTVTFTALGVNAGTNPTYQWQVNGSNVGTNSNTFSSNSLTAGQVVTCIMTSNLPEATNNPATSNAITISVATPVTPSVAIAITGGTNPTCPGVGVTFTATPVNGGTTPSYQWQVNGNNVGTNSNTFSSTTLTNGQVVTCIMTSSLTCTTSSTVTSNGITITITAASNASVTIAQTSGTNPLCAGNSATFTATVVGGNSPSYQWTVNGSNVGTNSPTFSSSSLSNGQVVSCTITSANACPTIATLGTGTTFNGSTSALGAAYPTYYGNGRQQWLIRASELTALGFTAGNIGSLGFDVGNITGDPITMNGYTIKMAQTAVTVLTTTFQTPTFTTVFGPVNYTPVLNSINTHTFSNNFNWDGTSNVIVDVCFSNQVIGNAAYVTRRTQPGFNTCTFYQADGVGGAGACSQATGTVTTWRPIMVLATAPGSSSVNSNAITVNVTSTVTPSVSIVLTSGTNPTCSGSSLTFTATPTNGGAAPSYQWLVNGSNAGTNSPTFTTSSLTNGQTVSCVMTSNASCASPASATSNSIVVNVTSTIAPSVSIVLTSGTNPTCSGSSLTFTATPTNGGAAPSYQWLVNGSNTGTNSPTFTTSSLTNGQTVSCVMTSNASCASPASATSNSIVVNVTSTVTPSVSIVLTSGTNPTCSGSSLTFAATPTNGGAAPSYQWLVNGSNAGTNSPTFTTSSLTNGQTVSCVMTSNASCVSPGSVASNSININVNFTATWFEDFDGDGYGNPASSINDCDQPVGYVGNTLDCNDTNNAINPDSNEICNNNVDENCNGALNEGCCSITLQTVVTNSSCAISSNGSIDLTVIGGVGQLSYTWSNGSVAQDISALAPGTYNVLVVDGNGCTASANAMVGNNGLTGPATPTNIASPFGVCVGQSGIVFTVDPVAGATSYVWVLPTGLSGSSTTNTITVSVASNFNTSNICVRAVNACGQSAQYCKTLFRFNSLPLTPGPITGQSIGVCANTIQTYSISPITTANNYLWTAPTGSTIISGQGTTAVTVQFNSDFGNNGVLRVQSQNCFGLSGIRNQPIYNVPAMPGNIIGTANNVCGGSTHTYSISPVLGSTSYVWTVPSGAVINSGQGTTSISVTFPSGYFSGQIGVSSVSACGTSSPRLRNIYVNPIISSAMSGTFFNLCGGGNYTYSIPAVVGASSYSWTIPVGCSIITNNGNSIVLNVPSNFVSGTLCVTAFNTCGGSVSSCRSMNARPDVPAAINGPTSVCAGQTNLSYSTTSVPGLTYNWSIPSGGAINSGQGSSSINATWGTSSGTLSVSASNACASSVVRNLTVAVVSCVQEDGQALAVELDEAAELMIYPNPNDGQFFIKSNADGVFVLMNNVGQIIQSFNLTIDNGFTEELKGLPTGMYFIQGNTTKGVVIEKIIVTNK